LLIALALHLKPLRNLLLKTNLSILLKVTMVDTVAMVAIMVDTVDTVAVMAVMAVIMAIDCFFYANEFHSLK
jgi:hypothetical protein